MTAARRKQPHPDQLLTRDYVGVALTALGFTTSAATLTLLASRGEGPPATIRPGLRPGTRRQLYLWKDAFSWAKAHARKPQA